MQYIPEYDYKYDKNDALVEAADKGDDALRKLLVVKARELGEVAEMVRDLYNIMVANVEWFDSLVLFKGQYGDWTDVNAIRAKQEAFGKNKAVWPKISLGANLRAADRVRREVRPEAGPVVAPTVRGGDVQG